MLLSSLLQTPLESMFLSFWQQLLIRSNTSLTASIALPLQWPQPGRRRGVLYCPCIAARVLPLRIALGEALLWRLLSFVNSVGSSAAAASTAASTAMGGAGSSQQHQQQQRRAEQAGQQAGTQHQQVRWGCIWWWGVTGVSPHNSGAASASLHGLPGACTR